MKDLLFHYTYNNTNKARTYSMQNIQYVRDLSLSQGFILVTTLERKPNKGKCYYEFSKQAKLVSMAKNESSDDWYSIDEVTTV